MYSILYRQTRRQLVNWKKYFLRTQSKVAAKLYYEWSNSLMMIGFTYSITFLLSLANTFSLLSCQLNMQKVPSLLFLFLIQNKLKVWHVTGFQATQLLYFLTRIFLFTFHALISFVMHSLNLSSANYCIQLWWSDLFILTPILYLLWMFEAIIFLCQQNRHSKRIRSM